MAPSTWWQIRSELRLLPRVSSMFSNESLYCDTWLLHCKGLPYLSIYKPGSNRGQVSFRYQGQLSHSLLEDRSESPFCISRVFNTKRIWEWCRQEDLNALNKKGVGRKAPEMAAAIADFMWVSKVGFKSNNTCTLYNSRSNISQAGI